MKVVYNTATSSSIIEISQDTQLSRNFRLAELANTSGDKTLPMYKISPESQLFNAMLQTFRDRYGSPIDPTSGYRQTEYNKKVGGDANSLHLQACAVDWIDRQHKDPQYIMGMWLRILGECADIGAVNLYDNSGYYRYHFEGCSDTYLGYKQSRIRIYTTTKDYNYYGKIYRPLGYEVYYYGK